MSKSFLNSTKFLYRSAKISEELNSKKCQKPAKSLKKLSPSPRKLRPGKLSNILALTQKVSEILEMLVFWGDYHQNFGNDKRSI